ncbi:MAG TPA: ABC transporter substrate-binding protein [Chloroflexota bacterium]|nr:ABC transporter substrate-binding protein [Chloroflexota bacterium]
MTRGQHRTTTAISRVDGPRRFSRRAVLRGAAWAGLGWAAGSLLMACRGPGGPPGQPRARVRMACWSAPLSEQTNVFAAQEFGWFAEQGIEFEFVPGAGGGDALKHILAGNADIAFANLEPMLFALDQGTRLRAVWNIYPENVFNIVALRSSGITRPEDLKGRRVGVYSQASGTRYNLMVILRSVGLRESDVETVAVGIGNFAPLMEGKIDAMAATDTGLWAAQQQGLGEVNVIWARDYLNTPTDAFIVTEEVYQTQKEVLRRFLRAYRQGTQWMLDHPEEAAQLATKYATDGQDPARNLEIIKLRNASTVNESTRRHGLGWFDMDVLRQVESVFYDLGLIKNRLDVEAAFTNEFVGA